jgi:hypothetical protein
MITDARATDSDSDLPWSDAVGWPGGRPGGSRLLNSELRAHAGASQVPEPEKPSPSPVMRPGPAADAARAAISTHGHDRHGQLVRRRPGGLSPA